MAIDRIGKGGASPVAPPAGGDVSRAPATDATRAFEAPGASRAAEANPAETTTGTPATTSTASATSTATTAAGGPLGALRSGAIHLDGYLDRKVEEATAHLGPLPAADLARVRAALRERLATDPTLVDLVKSAAGNLPHVPDDD